MTTNDPSLGLRADLRLALPMLIQQVTIGLIPSIEAQTPTRVAFQNASLCFAVSSAQTPRFPRAGGTSQI
jgi:hypothetical protein